VFFQQIISFDYIRLLGFFKSDFTPKWKIIKHLLVYYNDFLNQI